MLPSSHDRPCKLLLMCHWLELFIERDEPGHEGAGFDLWQCIWGLKTPPPLGAPCVCSRVCVCVRRASTVCLCSSVCLRVSICRGNTTTANKLRDCFALSKHPWMKKNWAGKSINQESCCHKCFLFFFFFSPFDGSRSLSSCAFNFTSFFFFFNIWHHSFQDQAKPAKPSQDWWAAAFGRSINSCLYVAFHYFTPSVSNQPLCCRPRCITFSKAATINLLR